MQVLPLVTLKHIKACISGDSGACKRSPCFLLQLETTDVAMIDTVRPCVCYIKMVNMDKQIKIRAKRLQLSTSKETVLIYIFSKSHSNIIAAEQKTVAECIWNLILNDIRRSVQNRSAHIFVKITCVN